jgi:hypothetical protein
LWPFESESNRSVKLGWGALAGEYKCCEIFFQNWYIKKNQTMTVEEIVDVVILLVKVMAVVAVLTLVLKIASEIVKDKKEK